MDKHKNNQNNQNNKKNKNKNKNSDHHRHQQQQKPQMSSTKKSAVWDCESSLYDSFELNSFNKQLDSAIVIARSLSVPRIPDSDVVEPKKSRHLSSKLARSVNRVIRSVVSWVKPKGSGFPVVGVKQKDSETYGKLWKSGKLDVDFGLEMIPEGCEESPAPAVEPGLRKTASERFVRYVGLFQ